MYNYTYMNFMALCTCVRPAEEPKLLCGQRALRIIVTIKRASIALYSIIIIVIKAKIIIGVALYSHAYNYYL